MSSCRATNANTVTDSANTHGGVYQPVNHYTSAANYRLETERVELRAPNGQRVKRGKGQRRNRRLRNGPAHLSVLVTVFLLGKWVSE